MPYLLKRLLPEKLYRQIAISFTLSCFLIITVLALVTNLASQFDQVEKFDSASSTVAHNIHYYDEVLTMSARMAAFTGDSIWEKRYQKHVILLDERLQQAEELFPATIKILDSISSANQTLVRMEEEALKFAKDGKLQAAQKLLFNDVYQENKATYLSGLTELVDRLEQERVTQHIEYHSLFFLTVIAFIVILLVLGFIIWKILHLLIQRLEIENTLAIVAKRMVSPRPSTIDNDIRWTLKFIANKAQADYALLIEQRQGEHPSIIQEWDISTDDQCNEQKYQTILTAITEIRSHSDNNTTEQQESSQTLTDMGYAHLVSQTQSVNDRKSYLICLINSQGDALRWGTHEISTLSRITEIVVRGLNSIENTRKLQLLAERDSLTHLLNRRKYIELLRSQWDNFRRFSAPCIVMMLDIDYFKRINDKFGHAAGDHVLSTTTAIMQNILRENDIIGRLGGEEFSILLPGTPPEEGVIVAERIRQKIAERTIEFAENQMTVTISIGLSLFHHRDENSTVALRRADQALYQAKQKGRNQVSVFEQCQ